MDYSFRPIGVIESPFREKFGIPRRAGLVPEARAVLRLDPALRDGLIGLEGFSHVWVLFVFHGHPADEWNPMVRPPRLGGERKMGVFATRAPHRPNPIGLSRVALDRLDRDADPPTLHLSGVDFLDGTPVLDVKPYLAEADGEPAGARAGWIESVPEIPRLTVVFEESARHALDGFTAEGYSELEALLTGMLELDPRPAFQRHADGEYAARVLDFDVHWAMHGTTCRVVAIRDLRERGE
jgi:tRNA-Thr(GGU) m(6)t(6)A37 methyltransferase TsaA